MSGFSSKAGTVTGVSNQADRVARFPVWQIGGQMFPIRQIEWQVLFIYRSLFYFCFVFVMIAIDNQAWSTSKHKGDFKQLSVSLLCS